MADGDRSIDILGLKPIGSAVEVVTRGATEGIGAFLSRICLPAAEEFGLLVKDHVSVWRKNHAENILKKAEIKLSSRENSEKLHAHPRLVMLAIDQGSWNDSDEVQEAWAGLLASACDTSGQSQDNLIFMNLLAQMTAMEVHLLNHMCVNAKKYEIELGLPLCDAFEISIDELCEISGSNDIQSLDLQLDHLREIGMMVSGSGIIVGSRRVNIQPSALALNLFVRAQGSVAPVTEYFGPLEPLPQRLKMHFSQIIENAINNPTGGNEPKTTS